MAKNEKKPKNGGNKNNCGTCATPNNTKDCK
jgi:hypothetical protein